MDLTIGMNSVGLTSDSRINRNLAANTNRMLDSGKTVSRQEMEAEWELIQAAQKNPARFGPLYNKYYVQIFRFVLNRCGDEETAGDIVSHVFMKAMKKLGGYTFQGVPFSAWLYRIASNEVTQHFRNAKKKRTVTMEDHHVNALIDEAEIDDFQDKQALMIRLLDGLKEDDLQLIEMRFFEQRPFKEISEILGITESNAKVKTYRIIERMKKKLKK